MVKVKDKSKVKVKNKSKEADSENRVALISFREFLALPDEEFRRYESIGLVLKNSESWGVSNFMKWPYLTVKEIQSTISESVNYEQVIDIIKELSGYPRDKILDKCWIDVFRFVKFVMKSIEEVDKVEEKLAYEPDAHEQEAGHESYQQFGYFATIDRLAGGDPLKYELIGNMEYSVIFSKLLLNKVDAQFAKNYQKSISKK